MVNDMGSRSYLKKIPARTVVSKGCERSTGSRTWDALPVFRLATHVGHRVLIRVEYSPTRVDVGCRDYADKVLEDVEVCEGT